MAKVYLLLGGNQGDRFSVLTHAMRRIEAEVGRSLNKSSFYETAPWGFEHEDNFLNQVVIVETNYDPHLILDKIQCIETDLGRVRTKNQYSERLIDIDILFYDDLVMDDKDLTIPHPRIQDRMFVLVPLAEVADQKEHPLLKQTVALLKEKCTDILDVIRIDSRKNS